MTRKHIISILIFLILTAIMTYPLITRVTTCIPGFFSSDESYASLWGFWAMKDSYQRHLPVKATQLIAYPWGMDIYLEGYYSHVWFTINSFLSIIVPFSTCYNIQIIANFILMAACMYLLVYCLTYSRLSALFSGIAFAFCPYQFVRSWQQLGLTYNEWIPLCLCAALLFAQRQSRERAFFFLLSVLLSLSFDFSVMYLAMATLAIFFIYIFFYHWRIKLFQGRRQIISDMKYFAKTSVILLAAFLVLLPQFFPMVKGIVMKQAAGTASAFNPHHRPFKDLFTQSAKPLSYLLPATSHPVFGKFTEQFIGSPLYGVSYTEHTLYLGWTPLILAFIAFRRWRRRRKITDYRLPITDYQKENFYIGFFVWLAIVAWLFSQPPYFSFPYFKIYMPSFFMYKILPMFRAYCRFGIVVMLAVSALAGFGLKFILEKFKSNRTKIVFTSLVCGLVLFEFLNFPPFKVIDLTKYPKVYDWLKKEKGDFVIAEYPLDTESANEYYKFCQTVHGKRIINGSRPGSYANKVAGTIWKLSEPRTTEVLAWMKVKYVLVHLNAYEMSNAVEVLDEFDMVKTRKINGLKFIRSFNNVDIYEVIAEAREPQIHE